MATDNFRHFLFIIYFGKTLKDFEEYWLRYFSSPPSLPYHQYQLHQALPKEDRRQIEMVHANYVDVSERKKDEFLRTIGFKEHLFKKVAKTL